MKRCLDCYALIRDDDKVCPYCRGKFEYLYNIDEAGEFTDDRWYKTNPTISKNTVEYAEKQFERFAEVCKAAGVSLLKFEKQAAKVMLGLTTPNEVRKDLGLGEINNGEKSN